jgi:hypothetical protein
VERADGGHRVQERRAEEDELIVPASAPPRTRRPECTALAEHHATIKDVHLRTLFAEDPRRGERLTAPGTWGPREADRLAADIGGWHAPAPHA